MRSEVPSGYPRRRTSCLENEVLFFPSSGLSSLFSLVYLGTSLSDFKSGQASRFKYVYVAYVECCCYGSVRVVWSSRRGSSGRLTVKKSDRRLPLEITSRSARRKFVCFTRKFIPSKIVFTAINSSLHPLRAINRTVSPSSIIL